MYIWKWGNARDKGAGESLRSLRGLLVHLAFPLHYPEKD